jgi:hypothetical protein
MKIDKLKNIKDLDNHPNINEFITILFKCINDPNFKISLTSLNIL